MQWLTPAGIASTAVGLGATVACDCLLQPIFDRSVLQRAVGGALTAVFGVLGTRWALSRDPATWSALRAGAATGAIVLPWFVLYEQVASVRERGHLTPWAALVLPVLIVLIAGLGAIVGAFFGLTTLPVVKPAERAQSSRSLDAPERALFPASLWLCTSGLAFVALHHPRSLLPLAAILSGLAGLALIIARDLFRLAWLSALHRGALPRLSLARNEWPLRPSRLPTLTLYRDEEVDGHLVAAAAFQGPYRSTLTAEPILRLPLDPRAATRPIRRRLAWSATLLLVFGATTLLRLDPALLVL